MPPEGFSERSRFGIQDWGPLVVMTIMTFMVLVPNFFLFSTDDLDVYYKSGEAGVSISQEGIGRYTFSLAGFIFRVLRLDYNSYLIASIIIFSLSLVFLYRVMAAVVKIDISTGFFLGFVVFLTFGLTLDLFQFVFAYLQYGIAFACAAGAIWIAYNIRSVGSAVLRVSILGTIGLGAYQLFAHVLLMATLALAVCSALSGGAEEPSLIRRTIGVSLLGLAIGAALYLVINSALQHIGVAGFPSYPVRKQGLAFVWGNLPAYRRTLMELLGFSDGRYRPLLPKLWQWALLAVAFYGCASLWRGRRRNRLAGTLAIILALLFWPNPANLFLADYWPSARSMSGFSIFFGLLCGTLSRRAGLNGGFGTIGQSLAITVGILQCTLLSLRYQDRFVQQQVDVALAQAILLHAYEAFPIDKPVAIALAITPDVLQTAKPIVYDYGRSMFATPWSAPAFLDYVSGHRVSAQVASLQDCASSGTRLSYEMRGDRLLVCLVSR